MNVELFQLLRGYLRHVAWLLAPLGVGVIAYLVCTAIRVEDPMRWYIVGAFFLFTLLICGIVFFFKWLRKRKKGASLEDALGQGPDGSVAQQGEINALRKQWKESLSTLKGSGVGGGGKGALAALPWFVIIGEPASGKSTLLRQSGIDFPVGDAAIRGLQGTRNCDWWFSNIGVFLDTAGRYVSDASAGEWASFLELVRKHRTGSPINGVIVALPAPDLLSKNIDQLDLQARQIRARLDELIDHLGVNFPVWITLTKVDLVAGFAEFFGQADAQTRRQMMGWTLDQAQGMRFDRDVFARYFQATVHRLREIRPVLIQKSKLRDRPAAYAFPDELGSMADALGSMLQKMFEPNVYQDTPFFRGLYVTSATQQGTPLQRAAQHIREMLGAPGAPPDPHQAIIKHAYFVKDLMNERVVSDREMTWTTKREVERNKKRRLGQNLTGASFGVLLGFLVLAFGVNAKNELDIVKEEYALAPRDAGGAERSDGLWYAAANASDDPYRNLGLSQQKVLKEELEAKQLEVYYEKVLGPLVEGYVRDARDVSIEDGLDELIEGWEQFRYVRTALQRAEYAFAEPPLSEDPEPLFDEDGNPIDPEPWEAPIDAFEAPIDFYETEEIDAFQARGERLAAENVVGSLGEESFPSLLMLAIWRNGTGPMLPRLDDIRRIYVDKLYEYLGRAAAEVVDIGAWRDGFREACEQAMLVMESPRVEQDELAAALDLMVLRASGPEKTADDPAATPNAKRLDPRWRSTLADDLEVLQNKGLIDRDDLQGEARFFTLTPWLDGTAASGGGPQAALTALAGALGGLKKSVAGPPGLAGGAWGDRGATIAAVLEHIDAEVETQAGLWNDRTAPHLAVLHDKATAAYKADVGRWGRAVEIIEPGMRRNALLKAFLEINSPSAFPSLATAIVEGPKKSAADNPEAFDRTTMNAALRELAKVAAGTSKATYEPRVATSIQQRAATEVEQRFSQLVDAAQAHWDKKCQELPPYTGDGPAYLNHWVDPEGRVVLLAKQLAGLYKKGWRIAEGLQDEPAAKAAWEKTVVLGARYQFFWNDLPNVQKELKRQLSLRDARLVPGGAAGELTRLDRDLPGGGGPKPFAAAAWLSEDKNGLINDAARRDLDRASSEVLREVLQEVSEYYNTTWAHKVDDCQAALASDSKSAKSTAGQQIKAFARELAILFGPGLRHNRGGLRCVGGIQGQINDVGRRLGAVEVEARVRLTFDCKRVPTGKAAQDRPFVRLEYRGAGAAQTSEPWPPNTSKPWDDVVWNQGQDEIFAIYMVKENGDGRVPFRRWTGKGCLQNALRDGGLSAASGGNGTLTWAGEGDYSESEALFSVESSDARMFQILMGGTSSGGNRRSWTPPAECVRLERP